MNTKNVFSIMLLFVVCLSSACIDIEPSEEFNEFEKKCEEVTSAAGKVVFTYTDCQLFCETVTSQQAIVDSLLVEAAKRIDTVPFWEKKGARRAFKRVDDMVWSLKGTVDQNRLLCLCKL